MSRSISPLLESEQLELLILCPGLAGTVGRGWQVGGGSTSVRGGVGCPCGVEVQPLPL